MVDVERAIGERGAMSPFIHFSGSTGGDVLFEVSAQDVVAAVPSDSDGLVETGYAERVREGMAVTVVSLRESLERVITASAQSMVTATQAISPAPEEIEVTFGLNATAEVGNN